MNEELLKSYEELKKNRNIINKIEPDFFFEIVDCLLKENREIKVDRDKFKKALGKRITYCNELEEDLFENCNNYVIPKQEIKDKIEQLEKNELFGKYNFEQIKFAVDALQELLEGREKYDRRRKESY